MRVTSIVVACGALVLAGLCVAAVRTTSAGDVEAAMIGEAIATFAKGTMPGGEFGLALGADGSLLRLESQVAVADVPAECLEASAKEAGGGTATRADKEWFGGETLWQVTREVDGLRHEILLKADGTVVGSEVEVKPESAAKGVLEASENAAPGSEFVAVERITGPEAVGGTEWHVKRKLDGEVLRISVLDDLSIGRVFRKIPGETKIPR